MFQCPYCGNELRTTAKGRFCNHCGADLTKSMQKQPSTHHISQEKGVRKPSPSYRPSLIIIGSIVTIGIVFMFFIIASSTFLRPLFDPPYGSGIEIYSDTDFLKYSSSGTGTKADPYILSNYYLTEELIGFSIEDTTKHFVITNCTIEINHKGIHIENVAPGTANIRGNTLIDGDWPRAGITIHSSPGVNISNNFISDTGGVGIRIVNSKASFVSNNTILEKDIAISTGISLRNSDSSLITNNTLEACRDAIDCNESDYANITYNRCENNDDTSINITNSDYVKISNNICSNGGEEGGIVIRDSKETMVSNNTILKQSWIGIDLIHSASSIIINNTIEACEHAIYCVKSDYVIISSNKFEKNQYSCITNDNSDFVTISNNLCVNTTSLWSASIFLMSSSNCQIKYNRIENNSWYGIYFDGWMSGESNLICLNSFINNNFDGTSQASDNGTSNYWYDSDLAQGNYWSDWNGTGSYAIAGTANAIDIYPLSEPPV
ncbi:MAG: right-handed parallel beta-helix repeat-containing protein [Candidatus Heimdallarchaeota archaeon]|nr:MAG: right-handed parallel beta-helix repeat-containing protein [Candidatus Heimdallarchaeota archaeon]